MRPETNPSEITHYFEYSNFGIEVLQNGLEQLNFGEFLVERQAISRAELFIALQLQDKYPGVRLGECLAKLGVLRSDEVETHLKKWKEISIIEA